jgi:hypothetical protein
MAWAVAYITKLRLGETVSFRPLGNSMQGKIESGQLCTVEPIEDYDSLEKGDIVLCKVNGSEYLQSIKTKLTSNSMMKRFKTLLRKMLS